ncbi:MAG: DNA (cytosine-5-)-methyltransferase [Nitrospirae bacterium]|nr:MAG: DNA (cytosine-5-)-methyltransferase [Nitrospirota bacterium]
MGNTLSKNSLTFTDLFAGIGGIRLAFEKAGCKCVFSSEWNKYAQETYCSNFGDTPVGDIRDISSAELPEFNILCAGFPCQPFSIAGVSKKKSLDKPHGFEDETQGTLFYEIIRILKDKKPDAFFLENVKNLERHDKGKTFEIIKGAIEEAGYSFFYKVINANILVPQNRERIYMVGFKNPAIHFRFPDIPDAKPVVRSILEENFSDKYTLTDHLWQYLRDYAEKHRQKGNGFGFGLVNLNSYSRTLSARYYKDGSEILIPQKNKNPRRLTPRECARLQGFPDTFKIPVSDTQAYKQFGNSVAVPVVEFLAKALVKTLVEKPANRFQSAYCATPKQSALPF